MSKPFRVVVVGGFRARVMRVVSLIDLDRVEDVTLEFLPCIATFGSYEDANGQSVRYLASVDYHSETGKSSLAPFFDEALSDEDPVERILGGVAAVVMGAGIEDPADVDRIRSFFQTMSQSRSPEYRVVEPGAEYESMEAELAAFRAMDDDERQRVTEERSMGPGKFAKLAEDLARDMVHTAIAERTAQNAPPAVEEAPSPPEPPARPHLVDPKKNQYSCHKCRTILLGQDDLEDPPHVPSKHSFSPRKHSGASSCHSLFLHSGLPWMGAMEDAEGKLSCPRCETKVGNWNWSGAQCSCGTWVVPAIQIPTSKVDLITPILPSHLPSPTIVHFPRDEQ